VARPLGGDHCPATDKCSRTTESRCTLWTRASSVHKLEDMPTWDQAQYLKFADERTRPAHELLARVPLAAPQTVIDLGCGPGNSTALLRARWPAARLLGVDNSPNMLQRARHDYPDIEWLEADVGGFVPEAPVDVLFANAVLHWLPDHAALFEKLFSMLRPGGVLAVQMPHNFSEPSHRLMRELTGPWAPRTTHVRALEPVANAAFYYDVLAPRAASVDIWQTRYEHVMADASAIVEWVKGTGLRPYLDSVHEEERAPYVEAYTAGIAAAYPVRADGRRLFSFPRLFIVAQRPSD
jgi:trans-aconitate 2-methyltransferase